MPQKKQGIAPSSMAQSMMTMPMAPQMPNIALPSHTPTPMAPREESFPNYLGSMGRGAAGGLFDTAYGIANLQNPAYWLDKAGAEGYKQFIPGNEIASRVEEWARPQNTSEQIGSILGDVIAPGPGEIGTAGKLAVKGLGPLMAGMSWDDVARRMGKPAGSFSSEMTPDNTIEVRDKNARFNFDNDPDPRGPVVGDISTKAGPDPEYLHVDVTSSNRDYHPGDEAEESYGFGTEMYKDLLKGAKDLGYRGISSDPYMRNPFSSRVWDRPGVTTKRHGPGRYGLTDYMEEYVPRGKEDWTKNEWRDMFHPDKDPFLPGVKEELLEQMKNRTIKPISTPTPPFSPGPSSDYDGSIQPMLPGVREWMMKELRRRSVGG